MASTPNQYSASPYTPSISSPSAQSTYAPPPPPPPKPPGPPISYTPSAHPQSPTYSVPLPPPKPSSAHPPQAYDTTSPPPHHGYPHHSESHSGITLPPPGWLPPFAQTLSKADLEELVRTPALVRALAQHPEHGHGAVRAAAGPVGAALEANEGLARQVAALHEQLGARRQEVSARLVAVRALEQQWRRTQGRMEEALAPFGPRVLHSRLGASITEGEQECGVLEESFLDQDGKATDRETAEWIRRVREARKKVVLRRERKARWDEGRVGGWR